MKELGFGLELEPIDQKIENKSKQRQKQLIKPFGSLGRLEGIAALIGGITGELYPRLEGGKAVMIFASDNGVLSEGVSHVPQEITAIQVTNIVEGRAAISVLCDKVDAKLFVVDVGMAHDSKSPNVRRRKIRYATSNIAKGPAMSREECLSSINIGIEYAEKLNSEGIILVGAGEIGMGNTTTSSAILSVLSGQDAENVTGRGTGLTDLELNHKIDVIKQAIKINELDKSKPKNPEDIINVLHKLGGFEIAALVGFYIRLAQLGIAVVLDGFIAVTAAAAANLLCPNLREYLILSHRSVEPGYDVAAKMLGLRPILDLEMRLGEAIGCPLAFNIIESAIRCQRDMATFGESRMDDVKTEIFWGDVTQE